MISLNMIISFIRSYLQKTLNLPPKVLVIGMALALTLVGLGILLWKKRKKAAAGAASDTGKGKDSQPSMPKNSLVRVWKDFFSQMPWRIRRYAGKLPAYVLMGEALSGKTELIRKFTDVEALSMQFRASHVASPLFQMYLSSGAILLEMPSSILTHTESDARRALRRLWRALPGKASPHGVVCLNATLLEGEAPENLKRLALYLRGKLNSMVPSSSGFFFRSSSAKKSVPVTLALTHMDLMEGYVQWSAFLASQGLSMETVWSKGADPSEVERALEVYATLLPLALTRVASRDYLAMVAFLDHAGKWLGVLGAFSRVLLSRDPFFPSPALLRLTFHGTGEDTEKGGPFKSSLSSETAMGRPHIYRHQLAAGGLLAAGFLGFSTLFALQYQELERVDEKLDTMELIKPVNYREMHLLFPTSHRGNLFYKLLPDFFTEHERIRTERLTALIRQHYLYPAFNRRRLLTDYQEQMVYLLGLLYATPESGLKAMILANPEEWERVLDFPRQMVLDYARYNRAVPDIDMELNLARISSPGSWEPSENSLMLHFLLRRVEAVSEDPFLTHDVLAELQGVALPVLDLVRKVFAFPLLSDIVENLKSVTHLGPDIAWMQRRDALLRHEQLLELLRSIVNETLSVPDTRGLALDGFMAMPPSIPRRPVAYPEPLTLILGDRTFKVNVQVWHDLILRSQVTFMMRHFMAEHEQSQGLVFFQGAGEFPDIWLNASNDGTHYFAGQARIDGRFTRPAFEKRVRPAVEALDSQLATLPVDAAEKTRFVDFVHRQVIFYSDRYVEQYRNYYDQYHLRVDNPAGLRFVLQQLPSLSSPFLEFLSTLKTHTRLDVGNSPMLRPVARRMDVFSFMDRIMREQDGRYPEWETYKGLIAQVQDGLSETFFSIPDLAGKGEGAALRQGLSPLGRMGLDILTGSPDSRLAMARQWLGSVGVPPDWQKPFLEPFQVLGQLGKTEIEGRLVTVWSDLSAKHLQPLRKSFPFDPGASEVLSMENLEKALHPEGAFWKDFTAYMGGVCLYREGRWQGALRDLRLPHGMLATVGEAQRIRSLLWNDKGGAEPLRLRVRPAILPSVQGGAALPVNTYLRTGQAAVFGFNQQPAWQPLSVEWWRESVSAAGMTFEIRVSGSRAYRELMTAPGLWSFYHLLLKGRRQEGGSLSWMLESPWGGADYDVVFAFEKDPWTLLRFNDGT